MTEHNERRYGGEIERLRSEQRLALLEVPRVVELVLAGMALSSMLDVGTGSGVFAEGFAAKGLAVQGVDLREDMLEAARGFVPNGLFQIGKMEALPQEDKAVDLVFMGHVLHEADDVAQALAEARRVAKQQIAILEWPYRQEDVGPPLGHRLKPQQIHTTAEAVGFKQVEQIDLSAMTLYRVLL